ncbi:MULTISPECIES: hypothetical protein [Oscillatoriales]|nr:MULTISPECIES: hypothetical protein [Oscillatoriales]
MRSLNVSSRVKVIDSVLTFVKALAGVRSRSVPIGISLTQVVQMY